MSTHSTITSQPTATGLPEARATELVELADGDQFDLRIAPVAKRIGDATVRMLAYNGSIPGPTLKVQEGSEIVVNVENQGDIEATVHWHGLRLENRYDGTHETQEPMQVGEQLHRPRHVPRSRACTGTTRTSARTTARRWASTATSSSSPPTPTTGRRSTARWLLTLDDILLEDGKVAPFSRTETTHSAMGRFGDVLLVSGETDLSLTAKHGEVVRFYLTNTANTRVFKVALPGARMKLVGGDSGHVEHEAVRRRRHAGAVGARGGRRAVRPAGRADARAPHPGAGLSAGRDQCQRGAGRAVA